MVSCVHCAACYRKLYDQTADQGDSRASFGYDATMVSPIFFGYTSTTEADMDAACAKVGACRVPSRNTLEHSCLPRKIKSVQVCSSVYVID